MKKQIILSVISFFLSASANAIKLRTVVQSTQVGSGRVYVDCAFDGNQQECFLDSGGLRSSIEKNEFSEKYPVVGTYEATGASGAKVPCDVINVGKVLIGNEIELPKFDLLRCKMELTEKTAGNKLSLDVLFGRQILFDFKNQTIVFAPQSGLKSKNHIKLQKRGHLAMAVKIEKKSSFGVWDTGAGLTLVNSEFVKRNPKLFKFIQSVDKGTDGTGKPIQMQLYQMKDLKIGSKSFPNTFVVGMDFKPMREVFNDDVDFVLGFNVISKANWYLDLNSNTWDIAN